MCEEQQWEREHPGAMQRYRHWAECQKMKQRHVLRLDRIEAGVSHGDAIFEKLLLADTYEPLEAIARKELATFGRAFGPVFEWMTSLKGIAAHTAMKVLAPLDNIERFATISHLRSYCGFKVIDGEIEAKPGMIKAALVGDYGVADQFIRHHTYPYRDEYDHYKSYQHEQHPETVCRACGAVAPEKNKKKKSACCNAVIDYTDSHLHNRALRKVAKLFLQHLWVVWRAAEGLPLTEPHPDHEVIPPPNWPL